jgi:hypothetical protein
MEAKCACHPKGSANNSIAFVRLIDIVKIITPKESKSLQCFDMAAAKCVKIKVLHGLGIILAVVPIT